MEIWRRCEEAEGPVREWEYLRLATCSEPCVSGWLGGQVGRG